MQTYIAPLLLFIIFFVAFGMLHRGKSSGGGCAGCTGTECSGKSECSKEGNNGHH